MIHLRRAKLANLQQLVSLFDAYRQFYRQTSDPIRARRYLLERLRRKESVVFIAWNGKEAVGFVQMYPAFDSVEMQRTWVLYDLLVTPERRRCGVARQLLEHAERFARRSGAGGMILETAKTNRPAQSLYTKLGWKRDRDFDRYALQLRKR